MTIEEALAEWRSKKRRMGSENAVKWFCKRVPGFTPKLIHYEVSRTGGMGTWWAGHYVATDGMTHIDLAPFN